MEEIQPKIPVEFTVLKDTTRAGLISNAARCYWWPYFLNIDTSKENMMISHYPALVEVAQRLPNILQSTFLEYVFVETTGGARDKDNIVSCAGGILELLTKNRLLSLAEQGGFDAIVRILVWQMHRLDISYMMCTDLLSSRERYIDPDATSYNNMLTGFREILSDFSPKTYATLFGIGALDNRFLDLMFTDMFVELLPPNVVLRILDAFLLEGVKILFRYGLAIIRGYKAQIKAGEYTNATNFWLAVKADAANAAMKANTIMLFKTLGMEERLPTADAFVVYSKAKNPEFLESEQIKTFPFDEDRSVISKMWRPMSLSSVKIKELKTAPSFSSPTASSASAASLGSGSMKIATRKSSFTGAGNMARPSVSDMVFQQQQQQVDGSGSGSAATTPVAAPSRGEQQAMMFTPPQGSTSVLARRGSASGMSMKLAANNKRPSNADGALTPTGGPDSPMPGAPADDGVSGRMANLDISAVSPPPAPFTTSSQSSDGSIKHDIIDIDTAVSQMSFSSSILNQTTARALLDTIPHILPLRGGYHLLFTSADDGYSLSSLYSKIAESSPSLLLVHLSTPYEHIVVGAYIPIPVQPASTSSHSAAAVANHNSRLHTAVFQLNTQTTEVSYYPWKPTAGENADGNSTNVQFLIATKEFLSLGGSSNKGSNAIRLDDDIHMLYTDHSDTYQNPPLVPDAHSGRTHGFAIKSVEVFCGISKEKSNQIKAKEKNSGAVYDDINSSA